MAAALVVGDTVKNDEHVEPPCKVMKTDKESCLVLKPEYSDFDVYLFDIEGTTTPITFVKDVLFPYARENVKKHLESHWEEKECKEDVKCLIKQSEADAEEDSNVSALNVESDTLIDDVTDYVKKQIAADRKMTSLKQLQGHMWRAGYTNNHFTSIVYDDVVVLYEHLKKLNKTISIYSSGSVDAQKDLFQFSDQGNLLHFISSNFDTTSGMKQDATSYKTISTKLEVDPKRIIFFTDVLKEAEAAKESGLRAVVVVRDGNAPVSEEDKKQFTSITSFFNLFTL